MLEFLNSDACKFLLESNQIENEAKQHLNNLNDLTTSYNARERQNRIEVRFIYLKNCNNY